MEWIVEGGDDRSRVRRGVRAGPPVVDRPAQPAGVPDNGFGITFGRLEFSVVTSGIVGRAGRQRLTITDEPWPNSPWLALMPTLASSAHAP